MKFYGGHSGEKSAKDSERPRVGLVVFAIGLLLVVFATRGLWQDLRDDAAAKTEYTQLRDMSADVLAAITAQTAQTAQGLPAYEHTQPEQISTNTAAEPGYAGSAAGPVMAAARATESSLIRGAAGETDPAAMSPAAMNPAAMNPATMNPAAMNSAAMSPAAMSPAAMSLAPPAARTPAPDSDGAMAYAYSAESAIAASNDEVMALLSALTEINPDFVGWIAIPGTKISYPVVRGADNTRYLRTTFSGASNPAGAIFMDQGCDKGFDAPVCLIYGHNMRDKSMFGSLAVFLDKGFLNKNPEIIVLAADGRRLVYRILEARRTDVWDSAYELGINDDETAAGDGSDPDAASNPDSDATPDAGGSGRLLILSTCMDGENRQARLLVFAALVSEQS